jgi:hypothetical protein
MANFYSLDPVPLRYLRNELVDKMVKKGAENNGNAVGPLPLKPGYRLR